MKRLKDILANGEDVANIDDLITTDTEPLMDTPQLCPAAVLGDPYAGEVPLHCLTTQELEAKEQAHKEAVKQRMEEMLPAYRESIAKERKRYNNLGREPINVNYLLAQATIYILLILCCLLYAS